MVKTSPEALEGLDIVVSQEFGPCYFIDDVPGIAGICRRQVDREIADGNLTRRKRGSLSLIQIDEAHTLRVLVEQRRKESRERSGR